MVGSVWQLAETISQGMFLDISEIISIGLICGFEERRSLFIGVLSFM